MSRLFTALRRLLPSRSRPVGYDLQGNAFFESPNPNGGRTRRTIVYREKKDISEYTAGEKLPVQWSSWLSHTRRDAPTIDELEKDQERRARLRVNVLRIEERDAEESERRRLLAPPTQQQSHPHRKEGTMTEDVSPMNMSSPSSNDAPSSSSTPYVYRSPSELASQTPRNHLDPTAPISSNLRRLSQEQTELARRRLLSLSDEQRKEENELTRKREEMHKSPLEGYVPIEVDVGGAKKGSAGPAVGKNVGDDPMSAEMIPRPRARGQSSPAHGPHPTSTSTSTPTPTPTPTSNPNQGPDAWAPTRARRLVGKAINTPSRPSTESTKKPLPFSEREKNDKREFSTIAASASGAGRSTRARTLNLASSVHARHGYTTCATQTQSQQAQTSPIAYHFLTEPLPYETGLRLQENIVKHRLAARVRDPESLEARQDVLLLLEHRPTYTTGRREKSSSNASHPQESMVRNAGAEFHVTNRGGQVTYHGPGQLVGYSMLDLGKMGLSLRCYVDYLQSVLATYISQTLRRDVLAPHPDGHVGVFASPTEKISSIGIHVRHRLTSHGFSLNVTQQPIDWFDLVLACGLADVHAASLQGLLERPNTRMHTNAETQSPLKVSDVANDILPFFADKFKRDFVPLNQVNQVNYLREMIEMAEEEAKEYNARHPMPVTPCRGGSILPFSRPRVLVPFVSLCWGVVWGVLAKESVKSVGSLPYTAVVVMSFGIVAVFGAAGHMWSSGPL